MSLHRLSKKNYSEDAMSRALADVRSKTLSLRAAAKKYGVPSSSLSDRNTGRVQEGSKWGRQTRLTYEQERTLIAHAMQRADLGIGFTKATFLRFVGLFAAEKGVPFNGGDATEKWWRGLKTRHEDFSLRSPEATSSGRHIAMTRERICKYFAALKGVMEANNLNDHPERIWNMDETGLSLAHKPAKVLTKKGAKAVHSKVSTNRELITVIACGNAKGECIPPHVILPGKSDRVMKGYDIDCAPTGTMLSVSETGWTKEGIGRLWFIDTFLPNIGDERPQLLVFDGHGSHNHIEFVEVARAENIILVELPSKTSHWTQPFDRTVFKSLKSKWNSNIQTFMSDTGVSVGHAQFFRMLRKSWTASMTVENISSGFVSTGICPYNPGAIPNVAYAPSELYVGDGSSATSPSTTTTPSPSTNVCTTNGVSTAAVVTTCTPAIGPQEAPSTLTSCQNAPSSICSAITAAASPSLSSNDLCTVSTPVVPLVTSVSVPTLVPSVPSTTSHAASMTQPSRSSIPATVVSLDLITSDEDVIDLPVKIDDNGNLCMAPITNASGPAEKPKSTDVTECSTQMALTVVESALTDEMKKKYIEAFRQGKDLDDSLYHTWKMYYEKTALPPVTSPSPSDTSSDLFTIPLQKKKSAPAKRKHIGQYFVISSDEAYQEMKRAKEEKEQKQEQIKQRKLLRIKIKKEKEDIKKEKEMKKALKK